MECSNENCQQMNDNCAKGEPLNAEGCADANERIPADFAGFLRHIRDTGWEYSSGESMEHDVKAVIAYLERRGAM